MAGKQKKGGRYTPKAGRSPAPQRTPPKRSGRSGASEQVAPQVGRRPSPPAFLFVIAVLWLACGVVVIVKVNASWKLIPAVVFSGIGVFYLRAALQTVVRRDNRIDEHGDRG